jgi:hypothetical protein
MVQIQKSADENQRIFEVGRADTIKSELPSDASSNSLKVTVLVPF